MYGNGLAEFTNESSVAFEQLEEKRPACFLRLPVFTSMVTKALRLAISLWNSIIVKHFELFGFSLSQFLVGKPNQKTQSLAAYPQILWKVAQQMGSIQTKNSLQS